MEIKNSITGVRMENTEIISSYRGFGSLRSINGKNLNINLDHKYALCENDKCSMIRFFYVGDDGSSAWFEF